jgi:hypothetical protein
MQMFAAMIRGLTSLHNDLTHDAKIQKEKELKQEKEKEFERLFSELSAKDCSKIKNLNQVRGIGLDIIAYESKLPIEVINKVIYGHFYR